MTIIPPSTQTGARTISSGEAERALVRYHGPCIRFDRREPFFPIAAGFTVFEDDGPSPSFPRRIVLPDGTSRAVEYAIWWDWDIQHLYELEHLWLYLDRQDQIVHAEGSWHGIYKSMRKEGREIPLEDEQLTVWAEPGKHTFAASARRLINRAWCTRLACGPRAGWKGVHVPPLFSSTLLPWHTPSNNVLVGDYLRKRAFQPSYDFCHTFDLSSVTLVPWTDLAAWIPQRVAWWIEALRQRQSPEPAAALSPLGQAVG